MQLAKCTKARSLHDKVFFYFSTHWLLVLEAKTVSATDYAG